MKNNWYPHMFETLIDKCLTNKATKEDFDSIKNMNALEIALFANHAFIVYGSRGTNAITKLLTSFD